jgi:POT family proton-dependent oligopeptide transporter
VKPISCGSIFPLICGKDAPIVSADISISAETDRAHPAITADRPVLFGHPRGLAFLAATELWDRISFHGMQALLVLYMVEQLLLSGHVEHIAGFSALRAAIESVTGPLTTQALATQIFGVYAGLIYFTPVFGGALGDRALGRTRAVTLGALLMTCGHFCVAFDESFLVALLLLILGAGLLRGNLPPQMGELYAPEDRRRAIAFQIYGAVVNLGAFIAPLVTGALGQAYGWHAGFGFAGFGMLFGLMIYLAGRHELPIEAPRASRAARVSLSSRERRRVLLLFGLVPIAALFWIAQSQVWNTYNLWVRDHIRLQFGHWTMPVPWLQSLDGLSPLVCIPLVLMFWRWQARRGLEPGDFVKMALGCFLFAASTFWLGFAELAYGATRAPLLWAVAFHVVSNIGWTYFQPTMLALYSRLAPPSINATMMGIYALSVSLGSVISGRLGGLYERLSPFQFWSVHAALCACGGVALLAVGAATRRYLMRDWTPPAMPGEAPS